MLIVIVTVGMENKMPQTMENCLPRFLENKMPQFMENYLPFTIIPRKEKADSIILIFNINAVN